MNNVREFDDYVVDWRVEDETNEVFEVIDLLEGNKIPKGLVPIERIFDRHDIYK
jgi:hypothetical protein